MIKIIRFADRNWRPDSSTLVSTGDYRIPEDMCEELADRAVREGVASVIREVAGPDDAVSGAAPQAIRRARKQGNSDQG